MKVGRFESDEGRTFWGLVSADEASVYEIVESFESWAPSLSMATEVPASRLSPAHDISRLKIRAPLDPGARVWAVGINYMKHIAGSYATPPAEPAGFMKPESAIVDPGGVSRFPAHTEKLDYEIELVLLMAKGLERGVDPRRSLLGYTIGDDGSVRDVGRPLGGPDLYSAKGQDQLSPVGPYVVTLGSIGGPAQPDLMMSTRVNGELRQNDTTKDMIFPIDYILKWINERNELRAGDLIFTGTVAGTCADAGYPFLKAGDVLEMSIEGIGTLEFTIGEKLSPRT